MALASRAGFAVSDIFYRLRAALWRRSIAPLCRRIKDGCAACTAVVASNFDVSRTDMCGRPVRVCVPAKIINRHQRG
jgi:hypothetical protein